MYQWMDILREEKYITREIYIEHLSKIICTLMLKVVSMWLTKNSTRQDILLNQNNSISSLKYYRERLFLTWLKQRGNLRRLHVDPSLTFYFCSTDIPCVEWRPVDSHNYQPRCKTLNALSTRVKCCFLYIDSWQVPCRTRTRHSMQTKVNSHRYNNLFLVMEIAKREKSKKVQK